MAKITIQQGDKQQIAIVANNKPLLMALEEKGVGLVPVGCRGGGCGVCRIQILSGSYTTKKMSRVHVSEDDQNKGIVLACRTIPQSNLTIVLATPKIIVSQQQENVSKSINKTTNKEIQS